MIPQILTDMTFYSCFSLEQSLCTALWLTCILISFKSRWERDRAEPGWCPHPIPWKWASASRVCPFDNCLLSLPFLPWVSSVRVESISVLPFAISLAPSTFRSFIYCFNKCLLNVYSALDNQLTSLCWTRFPDSWSLVRAGGAAFKWINIPINVSLQIVTSSIEEQHRGSAWEE